MDIKLAKTIAEAAAKETGILLNENFYKAKGMSSKNKNKGDIVTDIDLKAEKIILDSIKSHFPDHDILSEEAGDIGNHKSKYLWIVDPIDGTMNYYHGVSPYRIGIALLEDKEPILNVLYNPTKNELYTATKNGGAFLNGEKITVSNRTDLKDCVVMFHLSSKKDPRIRTMNILEKICEEAMQVRMLGSTLASASYIASGRFDIFFSVQQKAWDIFPGSLLIEEAGGKVTDIKGNKITPESTSVVISNGKVHDQIIKLLETI